MAMIRHRGPLQYQAVVKRKGFAMQHHTFDSRKAAERWASHVEADMDRGSFTDRREAEETSLAEAIERYRMEVTPSKKGALQENYRLDILLESPLSKLSMASIRSADVAKYRDQRLKGAPWRVGRRRGVRNPEAARFTRKESEWRGKPVSGSTVRAELSLLSAIYKTARTDWSMPVTNPVQDVRKPPKGKARERRFASDDEEARIHVALAEYADGWALPLSELAVETGMRRGEWKNLDWSDVNLADQTMTLHEGETKNDEGREVPLSLRAVSILKSLRPEGDEARGRVFRKQPRTMTAAFTRSRQAARARYVKECERDGIEPDPKFLADLHLHEVRLEATRRLFEKDLDTMEVASVTGHKTLSMLKRYTHLKAKKLAKKLG
jgi:integrase